MSLGKGMQRRWKCFIWITESWNGMGRTIHRWFSNILWNALSSFLRKKYCWGRKQQRVELNQGWFHTKLESIWEKKKRFRSPKSHKSFFPHPIFSQQVSKKQPSPSFLLCVNVAGACRFLLFSIVGFVLDRTLYVFRFVFLEMIAQTYTLRSLLVNSQRRYCSWYVILIALIIHAFNCCDIYHKARHVTKAYLSFPLGLLVPCPTQNSQPFHAR